MNKIKFPLKWMNDRQSADGQRAQCGLFGSVLPVQERSARRPAGVSRRAPDAVGVRQKDAAQRRPPRRRRPSPAAERARFRRRTFGKTRLLYYCITQ